MNAKQIIRDIARKHNLQPSDILGDGRFAHICAARREIVRSLRDRGLTDGQIGRFINRSTWTVYHYRSDNSVVYKRERMRRVRASQCEVAA